MMRRSAVLLLLMATAGLLGAAPATAGSEPVAYCSTTRGVVVAVDFSHWGGPIVRGCGTTPTTGFQLLNQGGFATTGTQHDGAGFICRIASSNFGGGAGYPTAQQEPCVLTPKATGYWSYWHADAGSSRWSYSTLGAMSSRPQPGSVDLWTYGGTDLGGTAGTGVPRFSPDTVRATNAEPTTTTTPATAPVSSAATTTPENPAPPPVATTLPPAGGATSAPATPQPPTISTSGPVPTRSKPADAAAATSLSGAPTSGPAVVDAAPTGPAAHKSGFGATGPAVAALVVVVLVAAAAGWVALRRRPRRDE
jgi:hypothetical protein